MRFPGQLEKPLLCRQANNHIPTQESSLSLNRLDSLSQHVVKQLAAVRLVSYE